MAAIRNSGFIVTAGVILLGGLWVARGHSREQNESSRIPTGKYISPFGDSVNVGSYPCNAVLSPNGKFVAVSEVGFRESLTILDSSDAKVLSKIDFKGRGEGLYYGLAFSPDSGTLYASWGARDKVGVYKVDAAGVLSPAGDPLDDASGKAKLPNNVAGLAVNSDGTKLYAVNNQTYQENDFKGSLSVFDLRDGKREKTIAVAGFPYAVAAITAGPNKDKKVYVSSERDGLVSVVDPDSGVATEVKTGSHPTSLLLNKAQSKLFVANADSDTVSVVDTTTDKVTSTILLRPAAFRGLPGETPMGLALSPDEKTLFVPLADMDSVAVVDLSANKVSGYIPVGWHPTAVAITQDGSNLYVANAKGTQARNPNGAKVGDWGQYIQNIIEGSVSKIETSKALSSLKELTAQVLANNQVRGDLVSAKHPDFKNPGIEHVIYVIKENRTYDQVLGDIPKGNGDSNLCLFPEKVTPNQHALVNRFALLDNFYVCAEVSADGWNWSTSGMANEYVSRNTVYNYSGRGRDYDFEGTNNGTPVDLKGIPDVATSPGGYLWDLCEKHHVTMRNFGMFINTDDENHREVSDKKTLAANTDTSFKGFDLLYADSDAWTKTGVSVKNQLKTFGAHNAPSRISEWKIEFSDMLQKGKVPQLMLLRLGDDHTSGTATGRFSPRALVADNDYAVGELVDAVSHSPIWKNTAIFIVEDDAQNGFDHVDAHRSTGYVISPFVNDGTYYTKFANTDSFLRTMELLLGLPPMNQFDAIAPPLTLFGAKPSNDKPYDAILPDQEILTQINQRGDYRAADSARLIKRFEEESGPDMELNDILWGAIKGAKTPRPR